jgi:hypothetical protein
MSIFKRAQYKDVWIIIYYIIKYFVPRYNVLDLPLLIEICNVGSKNGESHEMFKKYVIISYLLRLAMDTGNHK